MIGRIAQCHRAGSPQPLGKVEHVLAVIAVRQKCVSDGMENTLFPATMRKAVIAWIFREDRRVSKVGEESLRGLAGEVGSKPLAITFHPLPESGVLVVRLIEPGIEARCEKRQGIEIIVNEENEFVFRLERAQGRARLVVRVQRFTFQCPGECTHGLKLPEQLMFHHLPIGFFRMDGRRF